MMKQKENNTICDIMYAIRDCINHDNTMGALSLANDLYYRLLRINLEGGLIECNLGCGETKESEGSPYEIQ